MRRAASLPLLTGGRPTSRPPLLLLLLRQRVARGSTQKKSVMAPAQKASPSRPYFCSMIAVVVVTTSEPTSLLGRSLNTWPLSNLHQGWVHVH